MGSKGALSETKKCLDYIFYSNKQTQCKGKTGTSLQLKAVLDVFSKEAVTSAQPAFLPSATYPSDHIAIAADFRLEFRLPMHK